ncbi:ferrochelatase [Campylobacter sp. RM16187]|uniref:ferrochelatase n=1 Tax=Campylobacter sp. RM16187 TaxID=1660063 RepID=UPI0021B5AC78|nr:ferrochelatase [Campylobacter sp. RM16187]
MMNIENLRRLINAEVLNKPSVSSVLNFAFEAKNIRHGYAYIGINANEDEIKEAISNGAYAVIIEDDFEVIDKEIAFLKVDSLSVALMRLMRFESSYKNLKFYSINCVQKAILKRTSLPKHANILPIDTKELFLKIINADKNDIFFSDDIKILSKIAPFYDTVWTDTQAKAINKGSIFFTSIICDDVYYQNLAIPKAFKGFLSGLIRHLNKNQISFKMGDLRGIEHFEPVFVDRNFKITPFGASFRAFIVESDDELFEMEANFLRKNFKDSVEICAPKNYKTKIDPTFIFNDIAELKQLKDFRYAIVKCQKQELEAMLNKSETEKTLFDF